MLLSFATNPPPTKKENPSDGGDRINVARRGAHDILLCSNRTLHDSDLCTRKYHTSYLCWCPPRRFRWRSLRSYRHCIWFPHYRYILPLGILHLLAFESPPIGAILSSRDMPYTT